MRYSSLRPAALAVAIVIGCAGIVAAPTVLRAQDAGHHDDQPPQPPPPDHRDDHPPPPAKRDAHVDPMAQYRHDHPGATARCHDGFWTRTTDRGRACSKHGGIDVWIAL
jgi:hypothetical protein